jgi:hypothetical protein
MRTVRRSATTEILRCPTRSTSELLHDHRLIDSLAEQLDTADDPVEIRRLFFLVGELSRQAAEQVVFPAFRAALRV